MATGRSLGLLLPPSEGKATGGNGTWSVGLGRFTCLAQRRLELVDALAAHGGGDERLLGIGGRHLDQARLANAELRDAPSLPAWRRYTGVVWGALDVGSLAPADRRRAMSSVVVVSGLLGLARLDDPTPEYRLKMGAALPPFGRLSGWWRPAVSEALTEWARRRFVVDLLPHEHRDACRDARLRGVAVVFAERHGKVAGHDAKAAKGRLARHLLTSAEHPLDALESWTDDRFDLVVTPLHR